jgi:hypothetical protein
MKKIGRSKFFISLGTGIMSVAVFRNFNFTALRRKAVKDYPVEIKTNPLAVSRNKSGEGNVRS